jgi:hypothetical protein
MVETAYSIVLKAIIAKRQVVATYRGYRREMCPHVIGMKSGIPHALFYQFAGGSEAGLEPVGSPANWRSVRLDELEDVEVRDGAWYTANPHFQPHACEAL